MYADPDLLKHQVRKLRHPCIHVLNACPYIIVLIQVTVPFFSRNRTLLHGLAIDDVGHQVQKLGTKSSNKIPFLVTSPRFDDAVIQPSRFS